MNKKIYIFIIFTLMVGLLMVSCKGNLPSESLESSQEQSSDKASDKASGPSQPSDVESGLDASEDSGLISNGSEDSEQSQDESQVGGQEQSSSTQSQGTAPTVTVGPSASGSSSSSSSPAPTQGQDPTPPANRLSFRQPGDANTLGVWWWSIELIHGQEGQKYLDFCVENNISEIYLHIGSKPNGAMTATGQNSYEKVRAFVKKAGQMGIRVAALGGDYSWIHVGSTGFQGYVDKFNAYQAQAAQDEKFYSMHLDVEPHQDPNFKDGAAGRAGVMQLFADFVVNKANPAAQASNTLLEWDIPFWLTDIVVDAKTGSNIILAELMAKYCDTITIMSYRDTALAMYDVSKEEIALAKQYGCKIVLGAETYSTEGNQVSFMEEGKIYMAKELAKLNNMLLADFPDRNFGIAVHQIVRFFDLKDS